MDLPKRLFLACAAVMLCGPGLHPARAQTVRPWLPAGTDSIVVWATLARTSFQTVRGDSAGGANLEGYQRVAEAARHMLWRLGQRNVAQCAAIETVLDSLGLDTDVRFDPQVPQVVFVMVRNPYRPGADAVGYLMWFLPDNLRSQGVVFPPNRNPRVRGWFTGQREAPYEYAVVFQDRRPPQSQHMHLYRALPNGFAWSVIQYEREGPDFGPPGDAQFVDVNADGRPEVVSWTPAEPDSFIALAPGVPGLANEGLWVERPQGFVLQDSRLLPSPLATFTAFVRALVLGQRPQAARLLLEPAKLDDAIAQGWGASSARAAFLVEYAEPDQAWPEWFAVRHRRATGDERWIVHFAWRDGRWWIREWTRMRPAGDPARPITPRANPGRLR